MNQQPSSNNTNRPASQQTARQAGAQGDPSVHPVKRGREQRNEKKLRTLRVMMIAVVAMILIVGVLLLTLPLFRVRTIEVEGNSFYTDEQIIAASGIREGDEILSVWMGHRTREIDNRIYGQCNISTIRISCGLSKVTITVTEPQGMMYTEGAEGFYAFDSSLRVWEKNAEESAFSPFLKVKLPAVASAEVNGNLLFANSAINYDYITELLDTLDRYSVLPLVTYIDFSDKYALSCVIENTFRMELGGLSDFERKLECFYNVLREKNSADFAVIDVSDPTKATYRKIPQEQLCQ